MAGGLRFADARTNHSASFRARPKTFGDLISSDARFVGNGWVECRATQESQINGVCRTDRGCATV